MISRWLALAWVLCTAANVTAESGDLVRIGDLWKYQKHARGATHRESNWHKMDFDDGRWRFATSGFEVAEEHEGRKGTGGPAYVFQRRTFNVADPKSIQSLIFRAEHEEG